MGGNLTKTPLTAVIYAALLSYVMVLLPHSQGYADALGGFVMSRRGYVFMVVYGLWVSIAMAIVFANSRSKGFGLLLPLFITSCGVQWFAPFLPRFIIGETTGVMSKTDSIFQMLGGCGVTAIVLVLMLLLFKGEEKSVPKPGAVRPAEPKYKLGVLGLVIRLLVLPVTFCVLYYLLWYYLLWRVDAVREFYGQPEKATFMAAIIDILINDNLQVLVVLLKGLCYAVFSLPLLMQLPGKRPMFIASTAILFSSGALLYLIPSAVMPDTVRMAHLLETGVLLLVYGVIAGILLHTVYRREEVPAARPVAAPARAAAPRSTAPRPAPAPAAPADAAKK